MKSTQIEVMGMTFVKALERIIRMTTTYAEMLSGSLDCHCARFRFVIGRHFSFVIARSGATKQSQGSRSILGDLGSRRDAGFESLLLCRCDAFPFVIARHDSAEAISKQSLPCEPSKAYLKSRMRWDYRICPMRPRNTQAPV
jgi:hypothetical protein